MANVTLLAERNQANYQRKIGKYTLQRTYLISSCNPENAIGLEYGDGVSPDETPATDKIPGNVQIKHRSVYCGGSGTASDAETIYCYAIDRDAACPQEAGGTKRSLMTVTYEGWIVDIPLYWEERVLTGSENMLVSIDDPPLQIGLHAEGTSVQRPRIELIIVENRKGSYLMFGGGLAIIHELTGTVNEENWNPSVTEVDLFYPEGTWLYEGANIADHPGGYYTIQHRFLQIPLYCNCGIDWGGSGEDNDHEYGEETYPCYWPKMQLFRYRPYAEVKVSRDIAGDATDFKTRIYGSTIDNKVYCIAGTDTLHQFSDLGL